LVASAAQRQSGNDYNAGSASAGALVCVAAAVVALSVGRRRGGASLRVAGRRGRRTGVVQRSAPEGVEPIVQGKYKMGRPVNYVNPWEQRVEGDEELKKQGIKPVVSGPKYHPYTGPVYKKVPIVEDLQFPLDPTLYREPREPPAPGVKWGDGRDTDGNWYMDVDGQKVQYWQGVGRRKTACAIVRIVKGDGQFIINGRDAIEYFNLYPIHWVKACEPLAALSVKNDYDCLCKTFGGGRSGQAGAIRLGLARAMQEVNFNWRPLLKKARYLTRDWRTVESKKTGKPKARKSKPFHKR